MEAITGGFLWGSPAGAIPLRSAMALIRTVMAKIGAPKPGAKYEVGGKATNGRPFRGFLEIVGEDITLPNGSTS